MHVNTLIDKLTKRTILDLIQKYTPKYLQF